MPSGKYLVVVQVVGKASDEELVRRVGNDGGDDACGDGEQTENISGDVDTVCKKKERRSGTLRR